MRYEREEYVRLQLDISDSLDAAYIAWCELHELPDDKSAEELIWDERLTPDQRGFLADFIRLYERI